MTEVNQIWKCEVCGNIVEVLHGGADSLVCCGQPMVLQKENTVDAAQEKHVPVIGESEEGALVKVGAVPHPMTEEHHIEWIEVLVDGMVKRFPLKPGDDPQVEAYFMKKGMIARAYCNLHGLWASE